MIENKVNAFRYDLWLRLVHLFYMQIFLEITTSDWSRMLRGWNNFRHDVQVALF